MYTCDDCSIGDIENPFHVGDLCLCDPCADTWKGTYSVERMVSECDSVPIRGYEKLSYADACIVVHRKPGRTMINNYTGRYATYL